MKFQWKVLAFRAATGTSTNRGGLTAKPKRNALRSASNTMMSEYQALATLQRHGTQILTGSSMLADR
jgi:hypothetical protein